MEKFCLSRAQIDANMHTIHIPVGGYAAETEEGRRPLAAGLNMDVNNATITFNEKSSLKFYDICSIWWVRLNGNLHRAISKYHFNNNVRVQKIVPGNLLSHVRSGPVWGLPYELQCWLVPPTPWGRWRRKSKCPRCLGGFCTFCTVKQRVKLLAWFYQIFMLRGYVTRCSR